MVAALALAALVASAALAGRWGRPGAVLLAACSVAWIFANRSMEGDLLYRLSSTRGIVAADAGALAGLLVALVVWFWPRRERSESERAA